MNIALNKGILENNWNDPEILTNGVISGYNGNRGFAHANWPTYLTLDLREICSVKTIRFLLWDNKGNIKNARDNRVYFYRLLVSSDNKTWITIHDNCNEGINGWQEFNFEEGIYCRYIKIHCIFNSANSTFHIVEIQAFENEPGQLDAEITFVKTITHISELPTELKDGLPISMQFSKITKQLEEISRKYTIFNHNEIKELITSLSNQTRDVETIERKIQSVRSIIIQPVNEQISFSNKIGKNSIYLGIIGGIIGLISIALTILTFLLGK